ncbi:MAG: hypothetical protein PF569_08720 [Candidatus Woesearchaeota archaeon]|jgi:hypothetical protein|nr:hypothetical protein [Candidatus Woesearchaeota archaeon]
MNQIIKGTLNNMFNAKEDLFRKRIEICKECKLFKEHSTFGMVCNNKLYLNPITDEVSKTAKKGFKKGCGCILSSKTRVEHAKCLINK